MTEKRKRKVFRHKVAIRINNTDLREMMTWLHEHGHELHETVKFSDNLEVVGANPPARNLIVKFRKANPAMLFKLRWGGA